MKEVQFVLTRGCLRVARLHGKIILPYSEVRKFQNFKATGARISIAPLT